MAAPFTSPHRPAGAGTEGHAGRGHGGSDSGFHDTPGLHYLLALITSALVVGLAFFIKDERTKWIVVAVGIVMVISVLVAWTKEVAGGGRRR